MRNETKIFFWIFSETYGKMSKKVKHDGNRSDIDKKKFKIDEK